MHLTKLLPGTESHYNGAGDPAITGITADSRAVGSGTLFAALPGDKTHGLKFALDAAQKGAAAILIDAADTQDAKKLNLTIPIIESPNAKRSLALLAAKFYAPMPKTIAAITGTNGKTSGTVFTRQLWAMAGNKAASMGTIGVISDSFNLSSSLTTPDAVFLHATLQKMAKAGITHVALEASSHGLLQQRLDGLSVDVAAFTNLTRDHLDYHGTMESYFAAKMILFERLLKPDGAAILNADMNVFEKVAASARSRKNNIISFGKSQSDIQILSLAPQHDTQRAIFRIFGKNYDLNLPVIGAFQAMNIACAIGMAVGSGIKLDDILPHVEKLEGVPGRLQLAAKSPAGGAVFVDYAHTPDAIQNVLEALRPHTEGALAIIFGCGGDRDPGKRPLMGKVAEEFADRVIVTDDNPRSEEPAAIRKAIMAACRKASEIGDRKLAIKQTIASLGARDILVIAGKGHEQGQIVKGITHPFDDVLVAQEAVKQLTGEAA